MLYIYFFIKFVSIIRGKCELIMAHVFWVYISLQSNAFFKELWFPAQFTYSYYTYKFFSNLLSFSLYLKYVTLIWMKMKNEYF